MIANDVMRKIFVWLDQRQCLGLSPVYGRNPKGARVRQGFGEVRVRVGTD